MRRHGWLSKADLQAALADPMQVAAQTPADTTQFKAPHFIEFVKREAAGIDALGGSPESRSHHLPIATLRARSRFLIRAHSPLRPFASRPGGFELTHTRSLADCSGPGPQ